jgi:hypothetical protein
MGHIKEHEIIVISKEPGELRTTAKYHDTLVELCTNLNKSSDMLFALMKAELERKYKGLEVELAFILQQRHGRKSFDRIPKLVLKFYDTKYYNKFKLVEGLVGKE